MWEKCDRQQLLRHKTKGRCLPKYLLSARLQFVLAPLIPFLSARTLLIYNRAHFVPLFMAQNVDGIKRFSGKNAKEITIRDGSGFVFKPSSCCSRADDADHNAAFVRKSWGAPQPGSYFSWNIR
jgi:hypothetical protein